MTWDDVISFTQTVSAYEASLNKFTSFYGWIKCLKNLWLRLKSKTLKTVDAKGIPKSSKTKQRLSDEFLKWKT